MNLEPAPRLPKWIFFAIDAGLLTTAFIIVFFNDKNPYAPVPLISAVICVMLAAIVGLVPFLVDYAANSAEYVQQERLRSDEQVQRLHAAGESLARAAAQIKAVEEAVHKTAHAAETLPYRMQEKLAEFNAALAQKEENGQESLEEELAELRAANSDQLKAIAEKIHKTAAEWSALEAASRKQLTAAETAVTQVQNAANDTVAQFEARLAAALASLDARLAKLQTPSAAAAHAPLLPAPELSPIIESKTQPIVEPPSLVESVAVIEASHPVETAFGTEEPKVKKTRVPRKPKPEDTLAAMSEPAITGTDEAIVSDGLALTDEPHKSASSPVRTETFRLEPAESAASSDGATRLLATTARSCCRMAGRVRAIARKLRNTPQPASATNASAIPPATARLAPVRAAFTKPAIRQISPANPAASSGNTGITKRSLGG